MYLKRKLLKLKSLIIVRKFKEYKGQPQIGSGCKIIHPENISIGDRFYMGDDSLLQTWPVLHGKRSPYKCIIQIGDNVSFMSRCHVSAFNMVSIGNNVLFGDNVFVTDNFHGDGSKVQGEIPPRERDLFSKGPVIIEDNVWIGRNVCVLPGVRIGKCSIIGANAVVTKDIPAYCVAAGIPAKVIKNME